MFPKMGRIFRIFETDEEVPEAKMGPSPHQMGFGGVRKPLFRQKTFGLSTRAIIAQIYSRATDIDTTLHAYLTCCHRLPASRSGDHPRTHTYF